MSLLRERVTIVWLALMALTATSTWLLTRDAFSADFAVTGIFVIAAVKVRYVMLDFMELRHAPTKVRIAFQVWVVIVTAIILAIRFSAPG